MGPTENEADSISKGRLTPDKSFRSHDFCGSIDVAASNPCGCKAIVGYKNASFKGLNVYIYVYQNMMMFDDILQSIDNLMTCLCQENVVLYVHAYVNDRTM